MKRKISEINAVAAIMDSVFQQVDDRWSSIWSTVSDILDQAGLKATDPNYVKFNFQLAALAINMRSAFDVYPRQVAERLFTLMQELLERNVGSGDGYAAIRNSIMKYIEAYNNGILAIRNPLFDVAMLLYYKIGMENQKQKVVDEAYYAPNPQVVEYLRNSLSFFTGKWESLNERYEVVGASGRSPDDHDKPGQD